MLLSVVAGAILFFTYLVLAVGRAPYLRIDRPGAAIVGATLMIATGVISLDEAYLHIDFRTLVLLFGMMVLIAHLRMARFFSTTVEWIGARVHQPMLLLVAVVFVSGILSALFVNDTICLVFTPILIELARARGHRPLPYLLALVTGSNIGSVATITGNPQNMLIASLSHIRYGPFLTALGPVALFGLALDALVLSVMFRHDLRPGPLESAGPAPRPIHRAMMIKGPPRHGVRPRRVPDGQGPRARRGGRSRRAPHHAARQPAENLPADRLGPPRHVHRPLRRHRRRRAGRTRPAALRSPRASRAPHRHRPQQSSRPWFRT